MNKKFLTLAGVTLLSTTVLAACGNSNATDTSTYSYIYSTDPTSLDYLTDNHAITSDIITNLVDGLLENDKYGNIIPSLAEDWTVSKDGLTYTYTLRKDAKWYTANGEEYADVTAHDFVTGLKHAADKESSALYIVQNSIVGLDDYVNGKTKDFSTVGIKALDDHTVQYTLKQPEPYWNSKTTMGILFPVNKEFLTSKGDDFGNSTDASSILYNGPYLLSALTSKSAIEYTKNENYWDKDNVHIEKVKLSFNDGSDNDAIMKNFSNGSYTTAPVFPNSSNYANVKKQYGDNILFSQQGSASYYGSFNLDRSNYDATAKTTDAEKEATKAAVKNKDFRQAISFAFDREAYTAQYVGEENAAKPIRNLVVPSDFVNVGEQSFDDTVEKYLVTYGSEWDNVDLADGQNGLYDADKAVAEFKKAKTTLEAEGVQFPIHLDVPVVQTDENLVKRAQAFKNSIESTLGKDNVVIDLAMLDEDGYNNVTYYANNASQISYDMSIFSGWGPDYLDPSTYLDILDTTSNSSMTYTLGIDGGTNSAVADNLGFNDYVKLIKEASSITDNNEKRYDTYAKAQAWLTDSATVFPIISDGARPLVTRVVPFTSAVANGIGIKGGSPYLFKYVKLSKDVIKTADYEAAQKKYLKEKEASNLKAEEDLKSHIK